MDRQIHDDSISHHSMASCSKYIPDLRSINQSSLHSEFLNELSTWCKCVQPLQLFIAVCWLWPVWYPACIWHSSSVAVPGISSSRWMLMLIVVTGPVIHASITAPLPTDRLRCCQYRVFPGVGWSTVWNSRLLVVTVTAADSRPAESCTTPKSHTPV